MLTMKKIMFEHRRYGLQQAVLNGYKTMTRRVARPLSSNINHMKYGYLEEGANMVDGRLIYRIGQKLFVSTYRIGEVVAVAQSYHDIWSSMVDGTAHANQCYRFYKEYCTLAGWDNKEFVRADVCPNRITFTGIKFERLQDISNVDCLAEGIIRRDMLNTRLEDVVRYTFEGSFENGLWKAYATPQEAFAHLIDKVSKKGTWDRNPYVFAYSFELTKTKGE